MYILVASEQFRTNAYILIILIYISNIEHILKYYFKNQQLLITLNSISIFSTERTIIITNGHIFMLLIKIAV